MNFVYANEKSSDDNKFATFPYKFKNVLAHNAAWIGWKFETIPYVLSYFE